MRSFFTQPPLSQEKNVQDKFSLKGLKSTRTLRLKAGFDGKKTVSADFHSNQRSRVTRTAI